MAKRASAPKKSETEEVAQEPVAGAAEIVTSEPDSAAAPAADEVQERKSKAAVSAAASGNAMKLQNTSRAIQIIPLGPNRRQRIDPGQTWEVPDDVAEMVKGYFKTPFYQALEAGGYIKVHNAKPSRLGETELKSAKTPKPPADLEAKPEHVTQAEFIEDE